MNFSELILFEDNHLLIVNKPSGILVQGDRTGDMPISEIAKQYLKEKYNKPGNVFLGVIHRLDRPTSGCLVLARTSKALTRMTRLFADRNVDKMYWALAQPSVKPKSGRIVHYIEKRADINRVICHAKEKEGSKKAELSYLTLKSNGKVSLLEIKLITGRKHQIRAQLRQGGSSIIGDLKYGAELPNSDKSICLHCKSLSFVHPVTKEEITVEAPLPSIREWQYANGKI